jgi:Lrp/AsnC family transcriptional regulator, leucine-responsive regulatory protein
MNTLKSNLDPTDWAILRELQLDARLSYAEIGRRVGLSSPAVQERVRKLEDAGIIEGYHAKVNPKALGLPIMAITRLVNVHGQDSVQYLAEKAKSTPEVMKCFQVTGQDEFILHITAQSMEHLTDILQFFASHAQCITSIVIRNPVSKRIISVEELPYLRKEDS